jgi:DnaJ domain
MRPTQDFRRILDEKLEAQAFAWASPSSQAAGATRRPSARPVFLFGDAGTGFTAGPARPAASSGASPWTPVYGARTGAHLRPARRLTAVQQAALDTLRELGAAALDAASTDAEIRTAFRTLARRFHPDRHPGCPESDRARLSRTFATLCDAYRTLTTAVH